MRGAVRGQALVIGKLTVKFAPVPLWMHLIMKDPKLDPILLGASGYADDVFTTRLVSKTE
jgi:hypothetical protein